MKNEILDLEDTFGNRSNRFSKWSFIFSIVSLILIIYSVLSIPSRIEASATLEEPNFIIGILIQLSCVAGVLMILISFIQKEPSTWYKWVAAILNILLMLLLIGAIVFRNTI